MERRGNRRGERTTGQRMELGRVGQGGIMRRRVSVGNGNGRD